MFEGIGGSFGSEGRIDGDAYVTSHHDGKVGHEPPSAVLGHDGNLTGHGQVEAFNVLRHLFGFRQELGKSPFLNGLASQRLGQKDFLRVLGALVEDVIGDYFVGFLLG